MDDWRLNGQEEYLLNVKIKYSKFDKEKTNGDHDHCVFCWHKFMSDFTNIEDCSTTGYCTLNKEVWICEQCYNDFHKMFKWIVIDDNY